MVPFLRNFDDLAQLKIVNKSRFTFSEEPHGVFKFSICKNLQFGANIVYRLQFMAGISTVKEGDVIHQRVFLGPDASQDLQLLDYDLELLTVTLLNVLVCS